MKSHFFGSAFLGVCFCMSLFAQRQKPSNARDASPEPHKPVHSIDMSEGKSVVGLPLSSVIGYPMLCSSDGTTFIESYAEAGKLAQTLVADLYSISGTGDVKLLPRALPQHMREMSVRSLYPGEREIASLLMAVPEKDPPSMDTERSFQAYISVTNRDGSSSRFISLDLKFDPLKIAILNSGRFLMLGVDEANQQPILAMLDTDGSFLRTLDLDGRKYNASQLEKIYEGPKDPSGASTGSAQIRALANAVFVPYGSKVLLVQPGSQLPVHILGDAGEENAITLHLPEAYLPETLLATASKDTWVGRGEAIGSLSQFQNAGIVENPDQQFFTINPLTGETIDSIKLSGVNSMAVSCAAGNKLTALHYIATKKDGGQPVGWKLAQADR